MSCLSPKLIASTLTPLILLALFLGRIIISHHSNWKILRVFLHLEEPGTYSNGPGSTEVDFNRLSREGSKEFKEALLTLAENIEKIRDDSFPDLVIERVLRNIDKEGSVEEGGNELTIFYITINSKRRFVIKYYSETKQFQITIEKSHNFYRK